ncbi:hypothetical protein [Gloeocapsopsis dulcis]|nr:hypothetical protein [Gloeocapsopsis dulcis]
MNSRHFLPRQTAPHRRYSSKNSTTSVYGSGWSITELREELNF